MLRFTHLMVIATLASAPAPAPAPVLVQGSLGGEPSSRGDPNRGGGEVSAGDDGGSLFRVRTPRADGPRFRVVSGRPDTSTHGTTSSSQWSEWADEYCGGDSLIWFDMDENGDPVLGTVEVECL